jgi:hypothetical protein
MADSRRSWKLIGSVVVLVLIVGYALFGARRYLQGPVLTISYPTNGSRVEGPSVTVTGTGANLSYFYINGAQAFLNEDGTFSFVYTPPPGATILTAEGKDRFGRTRTIEVRFTVTK